MNRHDLSLGTKWIVIVAVFLLLASCEADSPKIRDLRLKIEQEEQELAVLNKNYRSMYEELSATWTRSLKYRFPAVQAITTEEIPLDLSKQDMPYLKSVRLQYLQNRKLKLTSSYLTSQAKIRPRFVIYLFDENGLNIHREIIQYNPSWSIFKNLPVNKNVTQDNQIIVTSHSMPYYFLIQKAPDAS